MTDPLSDRMILAMRENSRAITVIVDAAKRVWEAYQHDIEPAQTQVVQTLGQHNEILTATKKMLDTIITEQAVLTGHLTNSDDSFKALLIKSTTLSLGIKMLYNDPDTMTEALQTITEHTLDQVMVRLSSSDKKKLLLAIDKKRPGQIRS